MSYPQEQGNQRTVTDEEIADLIAGSLFAFMVDLQRKELGNEQE